MAGCQPPAGWERRAIQMFAQHGIALHVDSGPTSLNANGQPWGALSRAGQIPFADVLDLRSNWDAADAAKDAHFVPSGRRRAFRYVLFANKIYTAGDKQPNYQGVARGIPDSDFVVGNCMASALQRGEKRMPRADTTYFVHELGHTLGLRHGGFEDFNYKPNYYSVMNYAWALWALADNPRFVPYSSDVHATVDETHVDEHAGLQKPFAYFCNKGTDPHNVLSTGVLIDADLNCNGRYGERDVKANLSGDTTSGTLLGVFKRLDDVFQTALLSFNDWNAIKFTGGGVIGALTLPPRQDTPPTGELPTSETAAWVAEAKRTARADTKRLKIVTRTRELRRPKHKGATNTLNVTVRTVAGKGVKAVELRVSGGQLNAVRKVIRTSGRTVAAGSRCGCSCARTHGSRSPPSGTAT